MELTLLPSMTLNCRGSQIPLKLSADAKCHPKKNYQTEIKLAEDAFSAEKVTINAGEDGSRVELISLGNTKSFSYPELVDHLHDGDTLLDFSAMENEIKPKVLLIFTYAKR